MNKNMIAIVAYIACLVCFALQAYTKNYACFIAAIAFMMVGVSMTPRKRK